MNIIFTLIFIFWVVSIAGWVISKIGKQVAADWKGSLALAATILLLAGMLAFGLWH